MGLSLSFWEFLLACVYNFHRFGFAFSIIGIICSGLYLHFNLRDQRSLTRTESQAFQANAGGEAAAGESKQPLVSGADLMRAQQVEEEQKKTHRWSRILWIIYICFIVLIGTMSFVRLVSLFRRIKWRNDLDDQFPTACGNWSESHGCTRVTLESAGCTRPEEITKENSLIFQVNVDRLLNTQIYECVKSIDGAKLMHPSDLNESDENNQLIHVTFNSAIFGFIDDMFIITEVYQPSDPTALESRNLKIQSQLRIGRYDFDQNYEHVKLMLDCLNDTFMNATEKPAPCSQS